MATRTVKTVKNVKTTDAKSHVVEETKAVAVQKSNLPTFLSEAVAEDAGKGTSNLAADNLVPLVYILQTNSPQVNKRHADYVEGAESGDIWLRNSGRPAVSGLEGIKFQPCYFTADWVEWLPNRGGYAGRHEGGPDAPPAHLNAELRDVLGDDGKTRKSWVAENGNSLVYTRYHIGYVITDDDAALPYVIPMSSTGHTVSKGWMTLMNSKTMAGKVAPSWSCYYRLKTKMRSNASGDWLTWDVSDEGWVESLVEYERGKSLYNSFFSGDKKMDAPEESQGHSSSSGDSEAM